MKYMIFFGVYFAAINFSLAQDKQRILSIKAGPAFVVSKEKQIDANSAKNTGCDISLIFRKEKKWRHTLLIDFLSTNLHTESGTIQKFINGMLFYDVSYPVYKKNKLSLFLGCSIGLSGTYYKVQTTFGGNSTGTILFPFSQTVSIDYNLNSKMLLQAESSLSSISGMSRAGYGNHMDNRGFVIGNIFNNNFITVNKVSVIRKFNKRFMLGLEWQNYFQHIKYPSVDYSNSLLRNNLLVSLNIKI